MDHLEGWKKAEMDLCGVCDCDGKSDAITAAILSGIYGLTCFCLGYLLGWAMYG